MQPWIRFHNILFIEARFVLDFIFFLLVLFDPFGSLISMKDFSKSSFRLSLDLGMKFIPDPISQMHVDRFVFYARYSCLFFVRFVLDRNLAQHMYENPP